MIELRTIPYSDDPPEWQDVIEVCGPNTNGVYEALDEFIQKYMRLSRLMALHLGALKVKELRMAQLCKRHVKRQAVWSGRCPDPLRKGSNGGARHHCDAHFTVDKFLMNPATREERGRWEGYMNGESNLGRCGSVNAWCFEANGPCASVISWWIIWVNGICDSSLLTFHALDDTNRLQRNCNYVISHVFVESGLIGMNEVRLIGVPSAK